MKLPTDFELDRKKIRRQTEEHCEVLLSSRVTLSTTVTIGPTIGGHRGLFHTEPEIFIEAPGTLINTILIFDYKTRIFNKTFVKYFSNDIGKIVGPDFFMSFT